jgi:hypothetical protein
MKLKPARKVMDFLFGLPNLDPRLYKSNSPLLVMIESGYSKWLKRSIDKVKSITKSPFSLDQIPHSLDYSPSIYAAIKAPASTLDIIIQEGIE